MKSKLVAGTCVSLVLLFTLSACGGGGDSKKDQTITFGAAPSIIEGGSGVLGATTTSGLTLNFTSLTPSVCTLTGSTVNSLRIGTCTIAANQTGDATYKPASQATQSITIRPFLAYAASGANQVSINWTAVSGATSYNIYWGTSAGINLSSSKITGATSTYVQTGLTTGTHFYRVGAVTSIGEVLSTETFTYVGANPIGNFVATGSMSGWRGLHTATVLKNGLVLVTGGWGGTTGYILASAELYNPSTGTFSPTGGMHVARCNHSARLLSNGQVEISGGGDATIETYDPTTGAFSTSAVLGDAGACRTNYDAVYSQLTNGTILVSGGGASVSVTNSSSIVDALGNISPTGSMITARGNHRGSLLSNGKVLLTGGYNTYIGFLSQSELYDPATGVFSNSGIMTKGRDNHTSTLLHDGSVLIIGGPDASAEIYQ